MTEDNQRTEAQEAVGCGNEVEKRAGKRRFGDAYRVGIVKEVNRCTKPGETPFMDRNRVAVCLRLTVGAIFSCHGSGSPLPCGRGVISLP